MTQQQQKQTGWCFVEKTNREFTSTLNPEGRWVCGSCGFTTSKLLKAPLAQQRDREKIYL